MRDPEPIAPVQPFRTYELEPDVEDRPIRAIRQPEPAKPIARSPVSKPEPTSDPIPKPVEKATPPVEKATGKGKIKKLKEYDGDLGRKHTEEQIEEILDVYLQTGLLPTYVTQKMRWLYKHHRRLPERRELLEQAGKHIVVPETGGDTDNIIPIVRPEVHHQKRTS